MSTVATKFTVAGQPIEHRLDAIDRALLGVFPRTERLALVAQVETRIRELAESSAGDESGTEQTMESDILAEPVSRSSVSASAKRRSRLALSSGILGIVAVVLLVAMPITYMLCIALGDLLGEELLIALLVFNISIVAITGTMSLIMGIVGLVRLSRHKGRLFGHGWAITGLCTAPLPSLAGGLILLVTCYSLLAAYSVSAGQGNYPQPSALAPAGYISSGSVGIPQPIVPSSSVAPVPCKECPISVPVFPDSTEPPRITPEAITR